MAFFHSRVHGQHVAGHTVGTWWPLLESKRQVPPTRPSSPTPGPTHNCASESSRTGPRLPKHRPPTCPAARPPQAAHSELWRAVGTTCLELQSLQHLPWD